MNTTSKENASLQKELKTLEQEYQDNLKADAAFSVLKRILTKIRKLKLLRVLK